MKRSGSARTSARSCRISSVSYSLTVRPAWRSPLASSMRTRPLGTYVLGGQRLDLLVEAEFGVLEVHRVDRVRRDRNHQPLADDFLFLAEPDDGRLALAGLAFVHAVQVDEVDRFTRPVAVGDAVAQAGADERQVRVGILRLVPLLLLGELGPLFELVVLVAGPLREDRLEDLRRRARRPARLPARDGSPGSGRGNRRSYGRSSRAPAGRAGARRRADPGRPAPRR